MKQPAITDLLMSPCQLAFELLLITRQLSCQYKMRVSGSSKLFNVQPRAHYQRSLDNTETGFN